jgi:hypothetical protein
MGWKNAMSLMQVLHRKLLTKYSELAVTGLSLSPVSEHGLPGRREIRKDARMPAWLPDPRENGPDGILWQIYCDDLDLLEIFEDWQEALLDKEGPSRISAHHELCRVLYSSCGVPTSSQKAGIRVKKGKRLGAWIDLEHGWVSLPGDRLSLLVGLTKWALSQPATSRKTIQVLCGHWCHVLQ